MMPVQILLDAGGKQYSVDSLATGYFYRASATNKLTGST
jgi:hypothetical protein